MLKPWPPRSDVQSGNCGTSTSSSGILRDWKQKPRRATETPAISLGATKKSIEPTKMGNDRTLAAERGYHCPWISERSTSPSGEGCARVRGRGKAGDGPILPERGA